MICPIKTRATRARTLAIIWKEQKLFVYMKAKPLTTIIPYYQSYSDILIVFIQKCNCNVFTNV
jgi:hypothetical protein